MKRKKQFFRAVVSYMKRIRELLKVLMLIYKHGMENLLKDPLTGTYNRIPFEDYAEREMKRAERYKHPLCFIMLDVDGLKIINDGKGGHPAGDKALKIVVTILKKNCRKTDLIFRLGGDEFAILMPESSVPGVKRFLKKVAEELSGFSLSVSAGDYFWEKNMTLEELIRKADRNLYRNKRSKKNKKA